MNKMDTKLKLESELPDALKTKDEVRKRTIRLSLAAIRQVEVDRQITLDEMAVIGILQKEIKFRNESLEEARRAERFDLVGDVEAEIKVLEGFLPKAISEKELIELAQAVINESTATSPQDMGKVMKILIPRVAGRASGDKVSMVVRQLLQKL